MILKMLLEQVLEMLFFSDPGNAYTSTAYVNYPGTVRNYASSTGATGSAVGSTTGDTALLWFPLLQILLMVMLFQLLLKLLLQRLLQLL